MACTVELLLGLDLHKAHILFPHRFGDRFAIDEVVLVGFSVRFNELAGMSRTGVTLFSQFAPHEVRSRIGFQADQRVGRLAV
jgi:hypothetical protein